MTDARPNDQFVALAGLRGIAALAVMQWHGNRFLGGAPLPGGYLAVDFFFLLSGWVLAHAYDRRLDGAMTAGQFMRVRLIRIYPVYVLALTLAGAMAQTNHDLNLGWLVFGFLLLPNFWQANFYWMIPATWSLVAELAANLPFAAFHRWLGPRVLVSVIAVSALGLFVTAYFYGDLNQGHSGQNWLAMFPRVFFSFPLGVLLYRHRAALAPWAPRWATWPSIVALVAVLSIPGLQQDKLRDLVIVCVVLPTILLFASRANPGPRTATLALALGAMSYPLYLLHVPMFDVANTLIVPQLTGGTLNNAPPALIAGLIAALLALALLVDRYFDQPVRRWLLRQERPARTSESIRP